MSIAIGASIASVSFSTTDGQAGTNVPVTFGQPFAVGDLPSGSFVSLRTALGATIPCQMDVKTMHGDGSVRHAILSAVIPSIAAGAASVCSIVRAASGPTGSTVVPASFSGLNATVSVVVAGVAYTASLAPLLASNSFTNWLSGPIASEWIVRAPLKDTNGVEHPLLHARIYARAYAGLTRAKLDITLENSWVIPDPASVSGGNVWVANSPGNVTYDVTVTVPGDPGYSQTGLLHYNKTRWTRAYWWNGEPAVHIKHDTAYVIASRAVPNYDQTLALNSATVTGYVNQLASNDAPMKPGVIQPDMGGTGGRPDIGLNPGWCVNWLLSGDKSMKNVSVRSSVQSGAFSVCYRNKATDKWVDISSYPYACISIGSGSDDLNPATGRHEKIPAPAVASGNPNVPNSYHQVSQSYIPYLLTGDFVHLEMLQAWNEWTSLNQTPGYRAFGSGGVYHDEPRGVAWMLRTLAQTAYISPDGDSIKARALAALDFNLDYLNTKHTNSSDPNTGNALGFLHNPVEGNAIKYPHAITGEASLGIAPWQDDFFTSSVGMTAELGFAKAKPLLAWKAKFPVGRMTRSGTDYCWILASVFSMTVRATTAGPIYTSWADVWANTAPAGVKAAACGSQAMADACTTAYGDYSPYVIGQMVRYAPIDDGYVANAQPAFAYAADSDHPQGDDVWLVYDGRAKKQVYSNPQFAIVPRGQEAQVLTAPPDSYQVASGLPIYGGRAAPAPAPVFDSLTYVDKSPTALTASYNNKPMMIALHGSGGGATGYGTVGRLYTATVSGNMAFAEDNTFDFSLAATQLGSLYFPGLRPIDNWSGSPISNIESFHSGFQRADGKIYLISEHRYDALLDWCDANMQQYNQRQRVLTGGSMGAWGTIWYGVRRYNKFAALYPDRPRWRFGYSVGVVAFVNWTSGATSAPVASSPLLSDQDGGGSYAVHQDMIAYIANPSNKVRWIGWCIGRQDGYATFQDQIDAVAALRATKRGFAFYWNNGDHGTGSQMAQITQSYPIGIFDMDKGYPLFTDHSLDQDPNVDLIGGINIGLSFRNVVESGSGWSCEVTNVLGACTVKVEPISEKFTASVSKQTVTIPAANTWVPVSFSA